MQVEIDIYINSDSDTSIVERLIREFAVSSRYIYLEKPIQVLFKSLFMDKVFCTRDRLKAYVIETIYEKKFESDVMERAYKALRKHKILNPGTNH